MKRFFSLVLTGTLLCGAAHTDAAAKKNKTPVPAAKPAASNSIARDPYLGAILVDAVSNRVLFEDQADAKGYPASCLKLMDLLIILEKIEQRQLTLSDPVPVSARAAKTGGSQVWLAEKEAFTVDEMLYALMIQSANDAAMALAEKVAGSAEAFVGLMNQKAQALGMRNTVFNSVHGLPPSAGQQPDVTTARDFVVLCRELLRHRDALRYTSTREHAFRPNGGKTMVMMRNHNHLLSEVEGCDGLKTGFFSDAGFSIAATAAKNGYRLIAVVMGSADRKVRDAKAAELLAKGFAALPPITAPPPTPPVVQPKK